MAFSLSLFFLTKLKVNKQTTYFIMMWTNTLFLICEIIKTQNGTDSLDVAKSNPMDLQRESVNSSGERRSRRRSGSGEAVPAAGGWTLSGSSTEGSVLVPAGEIKHLLPEEFDPERKKQFVFQWKERRWWWNKVYADTQAAAATGAGVHLVEEKEEKQELELQVGLWNVCNVNWS